MRRETGRHDVTTGPTLRRVRPIGRESELAQVTERVSERRLVTLVGPGGIGKTTIARAALDQVGGDFDEGVHVVDLSLVDTVEGGLDGNGILFESFLLPVERACDHLVTTQVVFEEPGGEPDRRIRNRVQRLRVVPHHAKDGQAVGKKEGEPIECRLFVRRETGRWTAARPERF